MDNDTLEFIKEREEKIGREILWRTYATYFASVGSDKREYGVFLYTDGVSLYWEDFYRPPSILGIPLKKKDPNYVKLEGSVDISSIDSVALTTRSAADKAYKERRDGSKEANLFSRTFRKTVTRIRTNDGHTYFFEIMEPKEFQHMIARLKEEKRMGAFKAYDIRGIWKRDFDDNTVYRIGLFIPSLLNAKSVIVGRDVRVSSDEVHKSLVRGLTDSGADVWDLGLATTPMVYYATIFLDADASIQITASHNPANYNGLKISRKGAIPVGGDSGLKELEELVYSDKTPYSETKGRVFNYSYVKDEYVKFLRKYLVDLSDLSLTVDCSNGMANLIIKDILPPTTNYIYDYFDGSFPFHEPNPLERNNCKDLQAKVKENHSDLGIIYDGDADRVVFVDEKGSWIQPDYIIALIGKYYAERNIVGNALVDIRTSKSTTDYLKSLGFDVTIWKVGHAYAKTKMREIDAVFGGELAGHYYFKEFNNCDSGILASLIVLQVVKDLKRENKTISDFMKEVVTYCNSSEVNFKLEEKDKAIDELYRVYAENSSPMKVYDFDGCRIEFPTWWFNVRKSNTEPYLRIVCEAKDKSLLDEKLGEIESIIKKYK